MQIFSIMIVKSVIQIKIIIGSFLLQEIELRSKAERALKILIEISDDDDKWQFIKGDSNDVGKVFAKTYEEIGRVLKIEVAIIYIHFHLNI